jgi:serine/threonine-protein kinase
MIGETVFQYKILSKIGEGGMGTVYLAQDTELNRRVALKFLTERFVSDSQALARFRREAQATAALNHANIITIYEVGNHNGVPFIAMPYIEGDILSDLVSDLLRARQSPRGGHSPPRHQTRQYPDR